MLIKGRSTLHQHLGWESTNFCRHAIECRSKYISQSTLNPLSIKCWSRHLLSIDWVSAEYWLRCPSSVDQDVDQDVEHIVQHSINDAFSMCDPNALNNQPTISLAHQLCTTVHLEITTWYKWVNVRFVRKLTKCWACELLGITQWQLFVALFTGRELHGNWVKDITQDSSKTKGPLIAFL